MLFTVSPTGTTAGGYYGLRLDRTSQSSSSGSIPSILARGMKDGFRGSFPSMTKFWGSFSYVGKCVCMCIRTCVSMCACVSVCIESDVACYVLECPSMPVVALMIMFVPSSFHLVYLAYSCSYPYSTGFHKLSWKCAERRGESVCAHTYQFPLEQPWLDTNDAQEYQQNQ